MSEVLNEKKKILKDMPDAEASGILTAWWKNEPLQYFNRTTKLWHDKDADGSMHQNTIYRTKPEPVKAPEPEWEEHEVTFGRDGYPHIRGISLPYAISHPDFMGLVCEDDAGNEHIVWGFPRWKWGGGSGISSLPANDDKPDVGRLKPVRIRMRSQR